MSRDKFTRSLSSFQSLTPGAPGAARAPPRAPPGLCASHLLTLVIRHLCPFISSRLSRRRTTYTCTHTVQSVCILYMYFTRMWSTQDQDLQDLDAIHVTRGRLQISCRHTSLYQAHSRHSANRPSSGSAHSSSDSASPSPRRCRTRSPPPSPPWDHGVLDLHHGPFLRFLLLGLQVNGRRAVRRAQYRGNRRRKQKKLSLIAIRINLQTYNPSVPIGT